MAANADRSMSTSTRKRDGTRISLKGKTCAWNTVQGAQFAKWPTIMENEPTSSTAAAIPHGTEVKRTCANPADRRLR